MKIGDRIRVTQPAYTGHEIGDEGVIVNEWWSRSGLTMFGVLLDKRGGFDDDGWSYDNMQLEVIE